MKFLQNQSEDTLAVSLTPLVDIIFLLIIFFLVSSTFEQGEKNLGIQLPAAKGKAASKKKQEQWKISIDQGGVIYLNEVKIGLEALESTLRKNKAKSEKISSVIRADSRVEYGVVGRVLGLLSEYGYVRVAFRVVDRNAVL